MKLSKAIDKLKQYIQSRKIEEVNLKGGKLYIIGVERDVSGINQTVLGELGRAIAVIDLLEKGVPAEKIKIESASVVGSGPRSKRLDILLEVDDVYEDRKCRKCIAIVECKTSLREIEETKYVSYVKGQLYNMAHAYANNPEYPYPLVLVMYEILVNEDVAIRYRWYDYRKLRLLAEELRQDSVDNILRRESMLASNSPPVVSQGKVYFRSEVLTCQSLVDVKDPAEVKNLLKEKLHQKLRKYGIVDNDAFMTLLNLLLAKVYDEIQCITKGKQEPDFQVRPEDYVRTEIFYERIKKLYENARVELHGVDARSASSEKLIHTLTSDIDREKKILLEIVPYLQFFRLRSLRLVKDDLIGDIFLDFMHNLYRQERGTFFTHPNICKFVCKAVGVEKVKEGLSKNDYRYVLDPSCGSGTFLIEALKIIFDSYPLEDIAKDARKVLFGIDVGSVPVTLVKVNMVLHGDGAANIYERNALEPLASLPLPFVRSNIQNQDGCTKEVLVDGTGCDFILTNPPFSLQLKEEEIKHFVMSSFVPYRNGYTEASECIFIERWFQLLNPYGRLGAVLPIAIFDSKEYANARRLFLCYFKPVAVVLLPENAFHPFAAQKTVLVFAERRPLEYANRMFTDKDFFLQKVKEEKILIYRAEYLGYFRRTTGGVTYTEQIELNDLTDELAKRIKNLFENNEKNQTPDSHFISALDLLNANLSFSKTTEDYPVFTLGEEWKIVKGEKVFDASDKLLCETGDIAGRIGIILPVHIEATGEANRLRLLRKLRAGKFVKLQAGDVIIAPVRVYQRKMAVVTKTASERFLFSSDFIVLRKVSGPDMNESIKLLLKLLHPVNVKKLEELSSTGKSGYPKLKNPDRILRTKFFDAPISITHDELEEIVNTLETVYQKLM